MPYFVITMLFRFPFRDVPKTNVEGHEKCIQEVIAKPWKFHGHFLFKSEGHHAKVVGFPAM